VSRHFTTIVVCDFEYEVEGGDAHLVRGDLPNVLCMVAHVLDANLQHVRTVRMWRGDFGSAPPFDVGPDALFVAYSAWAELTCFMVRLTNQALKAVGMSRNAKWKALHQLQDAKVIRVAQQGQDAALVTHHWHPPKL
jgi:hypothetical protein